MKFFRYFVWCSRLFSKSSCFFSSRFCNNDWWALAHRCNFTSYVRASSSVAGSQLVIVFWHGCITCKIGNFRRGQAHVKRPYIQFKCVKCSLPVKTGKFTCFYAASTSGLQVISHAPVLQCNKTNRNKNKCQPGPQSYRLQIKDIPKLFSRNWYLLVFPGKDHGVLQTYQKSLSARLPRFSAFLIQKKTRAAGVWTKFLDFHLLRRDLNNKEENRRQFSINPRASWMIMNSKTTSFVRFVPKYYTNPYHCFHAYTYFVLVVFRSGSPRTTARARFAERVQKHFAKTRSSN